MCQIENYQMKEGSAFGDALPVVTVNQAAILGRLEIKRGKAGQLLPVNIGDPGAAEAITETRLIR